MPGFHTLLTWLYVLLMGLKASSAALNMTSQLQRRQCENTNEFGFEGFKCDKLYPTLNQIVVRYRDVGRKGKATPTNSAWFYNQVTKSNSPNDLRDMGASIMAWFIRQGIGSYSIFDGVDMDWHKQQGKYVRDNAQEFNDNYDRVDAHSTVEPFNLYLYCFCQALATSALNPDAYLFIRTGASWNPYSVWAKWEFPALTTNPNIINIWRVDPYSCNQERVLLWSRTRGDAVVQGFGCPITEPLNDAVRNALPEPPATP